MKKAARKPPVAGSVVLAAYQALACLRRATKLTAAKPISIRA
jgi:hypothetical protein